MTSPTTFPVTFPITFNDRVTVTLEQHVAVVKLNRPDKRNGLDPGMFDGLIAAGEALCKAPDLRAAVLCGEGKAFCAGLDWSAFLSAGPEARTKLLARFPDAPGNLAQRVCWIWQEVPVPVIAAVHGVAFGGGLQLALGADLRLVAPDARLSVMEVSYGLVPDMGATKTLLRLVREDLARELTFTGRVVNGEEAVQLGLCTRLSSDPLADALALAREIATRSPDAVRGAKRLYQRAADLDVRAAFEVETEIQLSLMGTPNQMEAAMATMQRRAPTFSSPSSSVAAGKGE